ncbi:MULTISPECIES: lipopolysaccharide biosynthesis protein [Exiguobacterium]|uniref:lipopolysaccharide biosynthesis protein n=1 Tax=Exiguobacterium TaxID=33986 RepID=UPI0004947E43|nr:MULTISPECIES: oligosaccharide flippase family protein [Exiguobacterium]HCD60555.1 hypothetical protein [Exiguobacterium sp.]
MVIEKKVDHKANNKRIININFLITIFILPVTLIEILVLNNINKNLVALLAQIELASTFIFSVILFGGANSIIIFMQGKKIQDKLKIVAINLLPSFIFLIIFISFDVFKPLKESMFNLITGNDFILFMYLSLWMLFYISIAIFKSEKSLLTPVVFEKIFNPLRIVIFLGIIFILGTHDLINGMKISLFISISILIVSLWIIYLKEPRKIDYNKDNYIFNVGEVIKFNFYAFTLGLLSFTYEKIDQIIISKYFSLTTLAIYFTLLKISFLMDFIPKIFNSVALPTFVKLKNELNNNLEEIKNHYKEMLNNNYSFSIMTGLLLMLIMELILRLGYMQEFDKYLIIYFILLLIKLISVPSSISNALINSFKKNKGLLLLSIATTVIQVTIVLSTVEFWGIYSVVIAKLVAAIIGQVIYRLILKQLNLEIPIDRKYVSGVILFSLSGILLIQGMGYLIIGCVILAFLLFKKYYLDFILGFIKIKSRG